MPATVTVSLAAPQPQWTDARGVTEAAGAHASGDYCGGSETVAKTRDRSIQRVVQTSSVDCECTQHSSRGRRPRRTARRARTETQYSQPTVASVEPPPYTVSSRCGHRECSDDSAVTSSLSLPECVAQRLTERHRGRGVRARGTEARGARPHELVLRGKRSARRRRLLINHVFTCRSNQSQSQSQSQHKTHMAHGSGEQPS